MQLMQHTRSQSGQVGIIIILIMVVLLTFGLSIASRSTREVALSQQEEESNRVFNAAEAGVERALATDLDFEGEEFDSEGTIIPGTDSSLDYNIRKNRILETRLIEGTTAMVQMQDIDNALPTNVYIDWSRETDCGTGKGPASLIVSIYNTAVSTGSAVRHYAYAACDRNDDIAVGENGSNGYFKRATIATTPGDEFMRIKTVYNDTFLRVSASSTLPTQAYDIRSEATSNLGNEARTVEVKRTLSVAPSVMDFALFSGTSLTK
ncbi:hypothetical protein H3C66_04275 [Patescibacteria group bacterium]|nr:hypothetical protein [Patescibacteria group bacterium]